MKHRLTVVTAIATLLLASGNAQAPPTYRVVPLWPQPLPNHWVLGSVTGVAVDAQDHVWVTHRGADSLEGNEKGMMATPPTSVLCCTAAPFVLEFDPTGKLLSNWGGPGRVDAGEAPRRPQIPTRCRRLVVAANVDAVAVPKKARNHQALVAPRPEAQVVAAEARRPVLRMRTC